MLSCVDGSVFARVHFFNFDLGGERSCVRPVCAAHVAAGPDGFRRPSPIQLRGQHGVPDIRRGVLVGGLTVRHQFVGLAVSGVPFVRLCEVDSIRF